jgi:DNA-binding beta-propeller fold protein YncE
MGEKFMCLLKKAIFCALLIFALAPLHAVGWERSPATTFAVFPQGAANPEGIAIDKKGNVYVTAFGVGAKGPGQIIVFNSSGRLLRQVKVANSSPLLLELAFHPATGDLLVIDFGGKKVLKVNSWRKGGRPQCDDLRRRGKGIYLGLLPGCHLADQ